MIAEPLEERMLGDAGSSFAVAEWTVEGRAGEEPEYQAPLHLHRNEDEAWYVLAGTLVVRVGDDEIEVPAGAAVLAPRGKPHTFWNQSRVPARFVLIMGPKTFTLIEEIHATEDRSRQRLKEIFEKHDSELVD